MIVQCPDCTTRYELETDRVPRERIRVRCPKCRYVFSIDGRAASEAPGHEDEAPSTLGFDAPSMPTPPVDVASEPVVPAAARPSGGYGELSLSGPSRPASGSAPALGASSSSGPASRAAAPAAAPAVEAPAATATQEPPKEFDLEIDHGHMPAASAPGSRPEAQPEAPAPRAAAQVEKPKAPAAAPKSADPADDKARRLARALVSDILVYNRDTRDQALAQGNLVQALGQEIKKSWELYKEKVTPEVANSTNHFREALNEILADGQKIF